MPKNSVQYPLSIVVMLLNHEIFKKWLLLLAAHNSRIEGTHMRLDMCFFKWKNLAFCTRKRTVVLRFSLQKCSYHVAKAHPKSVCIVMLSLIGKFLQAIIRNRSADIDSLVV